MKENMVICEGLSTALLADVEPERAGKPVSLPIQNHAQTSKTNVGMVAGKVQYSD